MNILVTGGSGFIGSCTVRELIRQGHRVKLFDCTEPKNNVLLPKEGWDFFQGDLRVFANCMTACRDIDAIIHNAAIASISRTITHPLEASSINITGMLNILKAAAKCSVKRFVFMSSAKIYGDVEKYPSSEGDIPSPVTPYALTKFAGEYYCEYFSKHHMLEAICLRPFSVYGPGQNIQIGYIGNIVESICDNRAPQLPGTPDLARDFTHVDDVVAASIQAATVPDIKFGVFNIGSGKAHSLLEVVTLVNRITQKNIKADYVSIKPGTALMTLADLTQARKVLKYEPKINLEKGLKNTIEWFHGK